MSKTTIPNLEEVVADRKAALEHGPGVVSLKRFCELTGRDRDTVTKWVKDRNCPHVRLSETAGEATLLDIRAVCDWREEQARAEGRKQGSKRDPITGAEVTYKERAAMADARRKEIALAADARIVVHMAAVTEGYSRAVSVMRAGVKDLPEELCRDASGLPEDVVRGFRTKANDRCRSILAETAKALSTTMKALSAATFTRVEEPSDV